MRLDCPHGRLVPCRAGRTASPVRADGWGDKHCGWSVSWRLGVPSSLAANARTTVTSQLDSISWSGGLGRNSRDDDDDQHAYSIAGRLEGNRIQEYYEALECSS